MVAFGYSVYATFYSRCVYVVASPIDISLYGSPYDVKIWGSITMVGIWELGFRRTRLAEV